MAKTVVRRVIGLPEVLTLGGNWLTKRGWRFTLFAGAILGLGSATLDVLGKDPLGISIPTRKMDAVVFPAVGAAAAFVLGGAMNWAANRMSGESRSAAEANSIIEAKDMRKTPEATQYQAEQLWERVFKYESALVNGSESSTREAKEIADCRRELYPIINGISDQWLTRLGLDLRQRKEGIGRLIHALEISHPLSAGMEATKEGFIESVAFALGSPIPLMVQRDKTGHDLYLVEAYRNQDLFDSCLGQQYGANRFLKAARRKAKIPLNTQINTGTRGLINKALRALTRNKVYMKAGKGMTLVNRQLPKEGNPFDAQPFLWLNQEQEALIGQAYGPQILGEVKKYRTHLGQSIFSKGPTAHEHIYKIFNADYRRGLIHRLHYDVEYAAGFLDQKPEEDISRIEEITHRKTFSKRQVAKLCDLAERSVNNSETYIQDLSPLEARAIRIGYHTNQHQLREKESLAAVTKIVGETKDYSNEIVQTRIYDCLARDQIEFHINLVDSLIT